MKKLLLLIYLCLLSSLLVAGVIATYSTYPLKLESYNSIYLNKYGGTGTNHYQNMMAMHMGRFTIDTQGQTVRSFALLSNISNEFQFYGPTTWNPNTGNTLGFHGVAILKYGSQLYNSNLNQGNVNPINPTNTPMSGTITIDFYLISYNPDTVFIPESTYTHQSGTVGNFAVSYSSENIDFWNAHFTPVTGPDGQPVPQQPYLDSGTATPIAAVPYEDPTDPIFDFSIIEVQESFKLNKAYGSKRALVAKAQVIVTNADASNPAGVTLTFTNETNTGFFALKHTEDPDLNTIPYKLYFNGVTLDPGDSVDWDGLVNATYIKDIEVTQIPQSYGNNLVAGTYRDTIIVNLTPKDTL